MQGWSGAWLAQTSWPACGAWLVWRMAGPDQLVCMRGMAGLAHGWPRAACPACGNDGEAFTPSENDGEAFTPLDGVRGVGAVVPPEFTQRAA